MSKIYLGLDSGSRTTKAVILKNQEIICDDIEPTGIRPGDTSEKVISQMLKKNGITQEDITSLVATGYGKNIADYAQRKISEISCHARGTHYFFPRVRTFIDIGGQDSKIAVLNPKGKVVDFVMNDKCAAGTGRFLEVVARILNTRVDKLSDLVLKSTREIEINSTCVVFAESEIIGLLTQNNPVGDIAKAVHDAIARRTRNLMSAIQWQEPIVFTGGVANNSAMQEALERILQTDLLVPEKPDFTGAIGAALIGKELDG